MTIVCVDDHPIMLKGLSRSIEQIMPKASVSAFGCADEALRFAKENGCDVLISEIELGGVNGLTLAKKMKKLNPKVNIIFVTVCSESEHAKAVMRLKPSGYLTKEATNAQILEELQNLRYPIA